MTTITSTAPASYAALWGFVSTAAAAESPPVYTAQYELLEYQPASYILFTGIFDHVFDIEAMGYQWIESYELQGYCTVFTGDAGENVPTDIMSKTYSLFTDIVMKSVVENRGGNGIPVLGITGDPHPFEIKLGYAHYQGTPGNIGGSQAGWQGKLDWSFSLRAYLVPA
jgi:hypothetical protein